MPDIQRRDSRQSAGNFRDPPKQAAYNRHRDTAYQPQKSRPQPPALRDPSLVTVERIKPLNTAQARARVAQMSKSAKPQVDTKKDRRDKRRAKLRDFLLGFTVGLVIFGIAAAIICCVLINIFI